MTEHRGPSPAEAPRLGAAAWVALSIPMLGMMGVYVAIGWAEGPWLPIGLTLAVAALLTASRWRTRKGRRLLQTDPAEGRRVLNAQTERIGGMLGRVVAVWLAFSIVFVIVLLVARL